MSNVEAIPLRINDDQYDKLSRKFWELEQRVIGIDRATLDIVALDEVIEVQRQIKEDLDLLTQQHKMMMSIVTMLARAEEFRIKKFVDKIS